jgi:REP element-mobilizing transposase RayT
MARPLRLEFSGAVYHVTARGDRCEAIFLDDQDRQRFLGLLGREIGQQNWLLYAYCLMGNHYHLLLETPEANLTRGMRCLNGVYTQGFNRRYGLSGHVLQRRYKAILVDRDAYLLELSRYVVLNPVRAGLVTEVLLWPWSSYSATAGGELPGVAGCECGFGAVWPRHGRCAGSLPGICCTGNRTASTLEESGGTDIPGERNVSEAHARDGGVPFIRECSARAALTGSSFARRHSPNGSDGP